MSLSSVVQKKLARRDTLLHAPFSLNPEFADQSVSVEEDLEYLSVDASQIAENIGNGKWTSVRVLEAYVRSSRRSQERHNCLTEVLYETAYERALWLDEYFKSTGKVFGPLHGVPVSLKDQFGVQGVDACIGITKYINKPSKAHSLIAQHFLSLGAVIYVKTNVPQTMFSFECSNPVFGKTLNPYDPKRSPGGSSGGEACLLASDGSPLGFGSDIGGSLRIPAHYSGVYGIKPTPGRFLPGTDVNSASSNPGFLAIRTTTGPMGRSVDDLIFLSKALLDEQFFESHPTRRVSIPEDYIPKPWKEPSTEYKEKKWRIGYWKTDGFIKTSPACQRAVQECVDLLREQGHKCIEVESPDMIKAAELFLQTSSSGAYKTLVRDLDSDPRESSLFLPLAGASLPTLLKWTVAWILRALVGDQVMSRLVLAAGEISTTELQKVTVAKREFSTDFRQKYWIDQELDFLICASQATPAIEYGRTWNLSPLATGTFVFNIAESTVGNLPVTFVSAEKDIMTPEHLASPGGGSYILEKNLYGGESPAYDAQKMDGIPVGVQIVGAPFEEERVLGAMKVLDEELKKKQKQGGRFGPGEWTKKFMLKTF